MADALCGPSNALQNFQKQTQVDRTLQQDRLISRQSPAQNFRSSSDLNAGALDPEFAAFEAGFPPGPAQLGFQEHLPVHVPHIATSPQPQLPPWANDFQQLHISSPSPAQRHFTPPAQANASWHQDFIAQQRVSATSNQLHTSPMSNVPMQYRSMPQPMYNGAHLMHQHEQQSLAQGKQSMQAVEQFDDAAFEAAFEAAQQEVMQQEKAGLVEALVEGAAGIDAAEALRLGIQQSVDTHQAAKLEMEEQLKAEELSTNHLAEEAVLEESRARWAMRNEADQIPIETAEINELEREMVTQPVEQEKQRNDTHRDENDALAATAGQLLEKVKDDTSEKFQQSQFLALMRKLRDKEVVVEGDNMVEVHNGTSAARERMTDTDAISADRSNQERIPRWQQDEDLGRVKPRPASVSRFLDHKRAERGAEMLSYEPGHEPDIAEKGQVVSSLSWYEEWHKGLEEASRQWFGNRNLEGMFAALEPLHAMMEKKGRWILPEMTFKESFGRELQEAHENCERFKETRNPNYLNHAWDLYYLVFRKINKHPMLRNV